MAGSSSAGCGGRNGKRWDGELQWVATTNHNPATCHPPPHQHNTKHQPPPVTRSPRPTTHNLAPVANRGSLLTDHARRHPW